MEHGKERDTGVRRKGLTYERHQEQRVGLDLVTWDIRSLVLTDYTT